MDNKIRIFALLLNGENQAEIELQYALICRLIDNPMLNRDLDEDEFALLVEDIAGDRPISVNHAWKLLLKTNCFRFENGGWYYNTEFDAGDGKIPQEQLIALFKDKEKPSPLQSQADEKKAAILQGIRWCIHMVQLAREDQMKGLPAFLRCGETDTLIGRTVAGTATSDALSLLCSGGDYLMECGIEAGELTAGFDFLITQTLACQCMEDGWDMGGFYPLEDQPEAERPTVDATCLAVMALGDFYNSRNVLEKELGISIAVENEVIEDAVLSGLEFLFRMQHPDGSFGIYRYEQEYPDGKNLDPECDTGIAIPNENCTRMVISAMGISKGSGIFDARECFDMYPRCSTCISRAYAYFGEHSAVEGEYALWAPYFGNQVRNYPVADVIVSTARVCRSFIPVWWQCEEERSQIRKYYADFLGFWMRERESVRGKIGRYSFKTPGREKYSVGTYQWLSYAEMIAAFTVFQGYNLFEIAFRKEEWEFLERVVNDVLELQHPHGHWNSPADSGKPFCAATLAGIELLREYRTAKGQK